MRTERISWGRGALMAALSAGIVFAAATVGSTATMPSIPTWYAGLAKPFFTPPNWVFGPAWTFLFALMAYAFWRVLMLPPETPGRREAIVAFLVQLALNALWSVVFFGLHSPGGGMFVVMAMWLAIAVNIGRFQPLDTVAAWCLAPYLAWVTFAAALNFGIWLKN